jgi:ribosome biogenesis GTPase
LSHSIAHTLTLDQLGWRPFFQQQISLEQWEFPVMRVVAQYRNRLELLGEEGKSTLDLLPGMPVITVGDWLLLTPQGEFCRLLERLSLFQRKAAGTRVAEQLIAANVDTLFVVTSLNEDYNLSRIERYLSLANEAGAEPVVILSKADLCEDSENMRSRVQALDSLLAVEIVNCLDVGAIQKLSPWCVAGRTVALMGSSGVGKSTLVNTLLGENVQVTGSIREDDSKGRHITTGRSLHLIPGGGLLMDMPGMRELQLADCDEGVIATFGDIARLSEQCRFADCRHDSEPGCAVQGAIFRGELDGRRLSSFQKLMREQAFNSATLAEKRARDRQFGKMIKDHLSHKKTRKR